MFNKKKKYNLTVQLIEGRKRSKAKCEILLGNELSFKIFNGEIKFQITEVKPQEAIIYSSQKLCNVEGNDINMIELIDTINLSFNETKNFCLPILDYSVIFKLKIK